MVNIWRVRLISKVAKLIEKKTSFNTQSKSKKLIYYPVNKFLCVTYMDNSHFFAQGKIIVSDFVYATLEIWLSCSFHGDNDHYVENKAFLICRCSCLIIGVSLVYSECFCCVLRFDRYFFLICNINCNINYIWKDKYYTLCFPLKVISFCCFKHTLVVWNGFAIHCLNW